MKTTLVKAMLVALMPLAFLSACGVGQPNSQPDTSRTPSTSRTAASHLQDVENRGLPVANKQTLSGAALTNMKAEYGDDITSAVAFSNDHDTKMYIIVTKTTAGANAVQAHFAKANWAVKADPSRQLVFAAERSLGSGWFEKYQKPIFRG